MTLADEITRKVAFELAGQREALFIHTINSAIGEGWTFDTIKDRLHSVRIQGRNYETVTLDGKPVTAGQVNFISAATGFAATVPLDESGNFTLGSLEVGSYSVFVTPPPQAPPKMGEPPPQMVQSNVPEKYRLETTSGLTATIKEGENEIPAYELKSGG